MKSTWKNKVGHNYIKPNQKPPAHPIHLQTHSYTQVQNIAQGHKHPESRVQGWDFLFIFYFKY